MTRKRYDAAPVFNVDDEGVLIQQVAGSTVPLLEIKDHTGSTKMTVSNTGEMTSSSPTTMDTLTVNTTATLPSSTSIGTIDSTELGYLNGVTSGIQSQIDNKAPLASPALTGTPTAPTATAGTNTTQVATTEFVRTEITNLVASAPSALDTLDELAAALGDDANFATTVTTSLGLKAPLASPAFTGTPTAPTADSSTDNTQLATTAFVKLIANAIIPVGLINPYAGSTAPTGWVLCFGQELAISQYGALYAVLGTTYGALTNGSGGAGSTHFRLPDFRGRVLAGVDNMGGVAANRLTSGISGIASTTLGSAGGDQRLHQHSHANTATFTGTANQSTGNDSPDHAHQYSQSYADGWTYGGGGYYNVRNANITTASSGATIRHQHSFTATGSVTMSNANEGAGSAQNVQPTIVVNYIIKV